MRRRGAEFGNFGSVVMSMKRSGLFLIEIVIVIFFFAVSSAVCMRIFAAAKLTTDRARELDSASLAVQNAAEVYKACGDMRETARRLGAELLDDGSARQRLDGGLTLTLRHDIELSDEFAAFCSIEVLRGDETITAVSASVFNGISEG